MQTGRIPLEKVTLLVSKIAISKYALTPSYFGCLKAARMSRNFRLASSNFDL
jgi:hypothetical protein